MTPHDTRDIRVGLIGLGRIGQGVARNLAKFGTLLVFDVSTEAMARAEAFGCTPAASVADLTRRSDIVFTSLPGPAEVEDVVLGDDGIVTSMRPGLVLFDLTTSAHALALRIEAIMGRTRGHMLDAPVSGGPAGAACGEMTVWAGGDRTVYDTYEGVLRRFSVPRHVGPIGTGIVVKLAHSMLGYTIMEAQAEALSLAVRAGMDPADFEAALRMGVVGRAPLSFETTETFGCHKQDDPPVALNLALQDMRLATQMAEGLSVPMRLAMITRKDMENVVAQGRGQADARIFLDLQFERAGVLRKVIQKRVAVPSA